MRQARGAHSGPLRDGVDVLRRRNTTVINTCAVAHEEPGHITAARMARRKLSSDCHCDGVGSGGDIYSRDDSESELAIASLRAERERNGSAVIFASRVRDP